MESQQSHPGRAALVLLGELILGALGVPLDLLLLVAIPVAFWAFPSLRSLYRQRPVLSPLLLAIVVAVILGGGYSWRRSHPDRVLSAVQTIASVVQTISAKIDDVKDLINEQRKPAQPKSGESVPAQKKQGIKGEPSSPSHASSPEAPPTLKPNPARVPPSALPLVSSTPSISSSQNSTEFYELQVVHDRPFVSANLTVDGRSAIVVESLPNFTIVRVGPGLHEIGVSGTKCVLHASVPETKTVSLDCTERKE